MRQLQAAFDGASSGDGSLFMVVGEPGIGKTTLCEQVAAYVRANCGTTLIGHCYEEGSLSLPYLAFVEAMRSYVLERDLDDLKEELGGGAADLARIVPELGAGWVSSPPRRATRSRTATGFSRPPPRSCEAPPTPGPAHRTGGPARRRLGHPGHAQACRPGPVRLPAAHRRHLPGRGGGPVACAVRGAGGAAPGVGLRAYSAARPDRRRGPEDDGRHRGTGGALEPVRGGVPPDGGQPAVRTGGAAGPGGGGPPVR